MAKHIHIFLGGKQPRITTSDSGDWEESKHKRDADGKFGSGGGGGAKPDPKTTPAKTAATARAANVGHAAETAAAYKALESHPMYSKEDFAYLKGKGYEPDEIKAFWDRDQKAGKRPQLGNKQSPMSKAEMNLLRHAMGGKPYEPPKK